MYKLLATYNPPAEYNELDVGVEVLISAVLFALTTPLATREVTLLAPATVKLADNETAPINVEVVLTYKLFATYNPPAEYNELDVGVEVLISAVLFALMTPLATREVILVDPATVSPADNETAPINVEVVLTYKLFATYKPPAEYNELDVGVVVLISAVLFAFTTPLAVMAVTIKDANVDVPDTARVDCMLTAPT